MPVFFQINLGWHSYEMDAAVKMLRAVRELRTVILNGWHSYEMDAAVKMLRGEEPFTKEAMRWMETVKH